MKPNYANRFFPPVWLDIILATTAVIGLWRLAYRFGFEGALNRWFVTLEEMPWVAALLVYGVCYWALSALLRGLLLGFGIHRIGAQKINSESAEYIAGLIRPVISGTIGRLRALRDLIWQGLRRAVKPAEMALRQFFARIEEEYLLWQVYRADFRHVFSSFDEFKRAYRSGDEQQQHHGRQDHEQARDQRNERGGGGGGGREAPAKQPGIAELFALFGLSPDCTRKEFEARYKQLIKQVHPDVAGPNELAAQLNDARAAIRKHKGKNW